MNKKDLVWTISKNTDLNSKLAEKCLNNLLRIIKKSLMKGDNISISEFGTFETKIRLAKEARNPKTGEVIKIESKRVPVFKPSKNFKSNIN